MSGSKLGIAEERIQELEDRPEKEFQNAAQRAKKMRRD